MKISRVIYYSILGLPLIIILGFWWQRSGELIATSLPNGFISLGRLFGLCLVYFVLLQLVLRSRIIFLESALGFSTLNRIHKKNGYLVYLLLLLHPFFLALGYSLNSHTNIFYQVLLFLLTYEGVFKAFIAFIIFTGVVISSAFMVRKRLLYELWYFVHLLTYIAILFAWDHQLKIGEDFINNQPFVFFWYSLYGITISSLLYWRVGKHVYAFYKNRYYIAKMVRETPDTYSLYIKGKTISRFYFKPGQFAFIRLLTKDTWWEAHPFSFSQAPNRQYLRFTIKASGDFTSRIKKIKLNTPVLIDGPHGEFTLNTIKKKKLLFIAGGAGITPIRAMLEKNKKNSILIYAFKKGHKTFSKELKELSKKNGFKLITVSSTDKRYRDEKKRITLEFVRKSVSDLSNREVFICGPIKMVEDLTASLRSAVPEDQIHSEIFSL